MKRTTEDYLKTIYLLSMKHKSVHGVHIAQQLGVSKPTVSITVKRLVSDGYVMVNCAHEISLTQTGKNVAEAVLERHAIFQQLLIGLGVDEKTAAEDACRMEHAVSPESFEVLKALTEKRSKEKNENKA